MGVINNEEVSFLLDTGAEVSLISSSVMGLRVTGTSVHPVSITHQPIVVKGEAAVPLSLGELNTTWNFLVVDDLPESVLGADFIDAHHKDCWCIKGNSLWLDEIEVPLMHPSKCKAVLLGTSAPIVARCTVELPARHQTLVPLRCKDRVTRTGLFESTRTPGGVLLSKTVVNCNHDGDFWVKAVNLTDLPITLFKNQKLGIVTEVEEISDPIELKADGPCPLAGGVGIGVNERSEKLKSLGINLSNSSVEGTQREQLEQLLVDYADVFSTGKRDIGRCKMGVQHHIRLKPDAVPVKQRSRRIPLAYKEEVKENLKAMMEDGVIERSSSEWASPLVIVRKRSGELRICVDYRKLNEATQVTSYPLPNITDALDRLADATYFTTIDMVSGYHQVEVAPEDREKTAFITPHGLFQYCRMPFGLAGAPGTFQSVVEDMLQVLDADDVLAYLDDVICFHSSFPDHLVGIERLLRAVRNTGFKLSGKKCQFATKSVDFLGHTIDKDGVRPQPEKIDIIREWARPQTEPELRKFIGVCTFWRKFVKGFSQIAAPLHELLNKPEYHWTSECEQAFNTLKQLLCTSVTLALPHRQGRFSVTCDASDLAVGFYLEQTDSDGNKRPIAFGGRKLSQAERNYSTTEKECLAVIQALKSYRPYLLGQEFDLYTDHESLKWLLTRSQEHSGRLWRWVDKFREFQCKVHHIPGTKNIVADALSRIGSVGTESDVWSLEYLRQAQDACPTLREVKAWLSGKTPRKEDIRGKELTAFHKALPMLRLGDDHILRHKDVKENDAKIVLPAILTKRALEMLHDEIGHMGSSKTQHRIRHRYFWPFMSADIDSWCKKCSTCQQRRDPVPRCRAPLQPITTSRPGELVTMDIVEYPKSSRGSRYCLVMIDHFTKWLELFPLRNQRSETIAKKIMDAWLPRHGAPEQLHSDQGSNLTSKLIREICEWLEIWKTQTTPFHPQSDGASERSIRTVNAMLAKMVTEDQKNWDLYISATCLAYNTAIHSSTKYTPSYLEFGRELRLPSDLVQPTMHRCQDHTGFASELKHRLLLAHKTAGEYLGTARQSQKSYYDRWAKAKKYKKGDLVLWFDNKTRKGRCMKLNRPWTGPWEVVKRLNDVVYRIKYRGKDKRGKRRVVHHNQLKPFIGDNEDNEVIPNQVPGTVQPSSKVDADEVIVVVSDEVDNCRHEQDVEYLVDDPPHEGVDVIVDEGRPVREHRAPFWMQDYIVET